MNCLIVDDNKIARLALRQMVSGIDYLHLVGDCESVIEATNIMNRETVDLLLLDIEMPKVSGFDFLRNAREHPLVILVTSRADYAADAFDYNVVDFLVKPVREDRFLKSIMRAKEIFDSKARTLTDYKEFFFIREKGVSTKLLVSDILYVQALGDYVNIHTAKRKYTVHYSIGTFEKMLPETKFMRVHRSYIVALDKIDSVEEGTAFIYQNPVPVGDSQRALLMKRLNLL